MHDEANPSTSAAEDIDMVPFNARTVATFLLESQQMGRGDGLPLDRVGDVFLDIDSGEPTRAAGVVEDELGKFSDLPPTLRVPAALRQLGITLSSCFSPIAEHVSAGFQLHSCTSLDAMAASASTTGNAQMSGQQPASHPPYDLLLLPEPPPAAKKHSSVTRATVCARNDGVEAFLCKGKAVPAPPMQSPLMIASPQKEGTALLEQHGVQLVLFRSRWTLNDAVSPVWEVCALGHWRSSLVHAAFYQSTKLALVTKGQSRGIDFEIRSHATLNFVPLSSARSLHLSETAAPPSLHARLLYMLEAGQVTLQRIGDADGNESDASGPRSRTFAHTEAAQLALSHARGMASIATTGKRILLLDLEEEGDGEEEEDEAAAEDEDGRRSEADNTSNGAAKVGAISAPTEGGHDSHGEDMALDHSDSL